MYLEDGGQFQMGPAGIVLDKVFNVSLDCASQLEAFFLMDSYFISCQAGRDGWFIQHTALCATCTPAVAGVFKKVTKFGGCDLHSGKDGMISYTRINLSLLDYSVYNNRGNSHNKTYFNQ